MTVLDMEGPAILTARTRSSGLRVGSVTLPCAASFAWRVSRRRFEAAVVVDFEGFFTCWGGRRSDASAAGARRRAPAWLRRFPLLCGNRGGNNVAGNPSRLAEG